MSLYYFSNEPPIWQGSIVETIPARYDLLNVFITLSPAVEPFAPHRDVLNHKG